MKKEEIIQNLVAENGYDDYLEIGIHKGFCFFQVRCKKKVGIDPRIKIPLKRKVRNVFRYWGNIFNSYHEISSDQYFEKNQNKDKFDLVFIDGLHTFEQSLVDSLNSLKCLNAPGHLVLHDCFPPHEAAATVAKDIQEARTMDIPGWTDEWCGDVWKTVYYLKVKFKDQLKVEVVNSDYGVGKVKVEGEISNELLKIDNELVAQINKLSYKDLLNNPEKYIGLVEV